MYDRYVHVHIMHMAAFRSGQYVHMYGVCIWLTGSAV